MGFRKNLAAVIALTTIWVFGLGSCGDGKKDSDENTGANITTIGRIDFRNYDPIIYETFVDGNSKGAIPKNPDTNNPYMYGLGIISVEDTFSNPDIGANRYHILDFRSGGAIHDTDEFFAVPDRTGSGTQYYYITKCIKNSAFSC